MQNRKLILILCLLINLKITAQTNSFKIQSEILGEEREILVSLPASYGLDGSDFNYPLVLLTDGEWHFNMVQEMSKLLYQDGLPKMIVAGIVNTDRGRDLTISNTDEIPNSGKSATFLEFIEKELIGALESNYKVSNYRVLLGHSAGGLFATYSMIQRLNLFDAYVSVTPTIRWDDFRIMDLLTVDYLKALKDKSPKYVLGIGNEDGLEKEGVFRLKVKMDSLKLADYRFEVYPNDSHVMVPWKAYFDGLKHVFEPFKIPKEYSGMEFSHTIKYYKEIGKEYKYDERVPQRILMNRGYLARESKNYSDAIQIYEYFKAEYPNIPIPYMALGDIYFELKEYKKARENYGPIHNVMPSEHISTRLKEIEKLLEID